MSCLEPNQKRIKMENNEYPLQESLGLTDLPSFQEVKEMCESPDPFAVSPSSESNSPPPGTSNSCEFKLIPEEEGESQCQEISDSKKNSPNSELGGGESPVTKKETHWKGSPLSDLHRGRSIYGMPQMHPIKPSSNHTVMYQIGPVRKETCNSRTDAWDCDHVRMPCSPQNKYPVGDNVKSRWQMVKAALQQPINNSKDLEAAIMSYNNKYLGRWDFSGLHYFFEEAIDEVESRHCFSELLPKIIELALQLPVLITRPLPLLRQHQSHSISLTQQQVACLLANAFFCTFPRRNASKKASEYASFPDINFNRLFQGQKKKSMKRLCEKLKCIFHYFRRISVNRPNGNITFSRRYIPPGSCPSWDSSGHYFRKLHISSQGTIESSGKGMLQVDFANKMIGGGVLGWGCVQEEIRFVICPELIIARLFTECLDKTEALIINGCEQYSVYNGYSDTFTWTGDYQDRSPRDSSGRMLSTVVAIDALYFRYPSQQYTTINMVRELNKAYSGFYNPEINPDHLSAISTGNWGCGVYHGNARLKALLQLMAASQTGRPMAYFTFGDSELRDDVAQIHKFLVDHKVTVGLLWRHLSRYYDQCYRSGTFNTDLYDYLFKALDPTYCKKGRPTAVDLRSPSKMKTTDFRNEKLEHTESPKRGILGNEKHTLSKLSLHSGASSKIHVANAVKVHSAPAPCNQIPSTTDQDQSVQKISENSLSGEATGSKNPFRVGKSSNEDKLKLPQSPITKMWERNVSAELTNAKSASLLKCHSSPSSHNSPQKAGPVKVDSSLSKNKNALDDIAINDHTGAEGIKHNTNECSENSSGIPSELNKRPHCLTIQKRISDYFYELNVPK